MQPQHLQQSDRYFERLSATARAHISPYPWGVVRLQFDEARLRHGFAVLEDIAGLFRDGTPFDAPQHDPLPEELALDDTATGKTIWLVLPRSTQNGQDVCATGTPEARYHVSQLAEVADNSLPHRREEPVEVAVPNLRLMVRENAPTGHEALALARIDQITDGRAVQLSRAVPPTSLVASCHPAFASMLTDAIAVVEGRLTWIDGLVGNPGAGGLEDRDYLRLLVLNRTRPILRHMASLDNLHPERLFETLAGLIGELTTFETGAERSAYIPTTYNHEDPGPELRNLVSRLRNLLGKDLSRVQRLTREKREQFVSFSSEEPGVFSGFRLVLDIRTDRDPQGIAQYLESTIKFGAAGDISKLVSNNTRGLRVNALYQAPHEMRGYPGHHYFEIQCEGDHWQGCARDRRIYAHVSGEWPDLEMNIWSIPQG